MLLLQAETNPHPSAAGHDNNISVENNGGRSPECWFCRLAASPLRTAFPHAIHRLSTILSTVGRADKPTSNNGGFDAVADIAEPFCAVQNLRLRGSTICVALILSFDPVLVVVVNDHWGIRK
jgi:hypothetical protein